jgi:hypothetical protein
VAVADFVVEGWRRAADGWDAHSLVSDELAPGRLPESGTDVVRPTVAGRKQARIRIERRKKRGRPRRVFVAM